VPSKALADAMMWAELKLFAKGYDKDCAGIGKSPVQKVNLNTAGGGMQAVYHNINKSIGKSILLVW
jgi:hypothetical protein